MGSPIRLSDAFGSPSLAEREWVVSIAELRAAGLSDDEVAHRVEVGLLFRRHRGVYAVGRPQLSARGVRRAAWLACGPGSAVSHISAADDWGIRRSTAAVHVSAPRGRHGHAGLVVHRPRLLPPEEIVERGGYAVTSVARTILDMSPRQRVDTVGRWLHEAGVQRVLDVHEVWATLARHPHHRGHRIVAAALELEVLPTRSGLEAAFLAISRRARMPRVNANEHLWSGDAWEEVDFHYPRLGLVVETDGARYHGSRWRRRRDAAKDARFRATGRTVWRIPEIAITLEPAAVAAELRRLHASLGRSNPSDGRIREPSGPAAGGGGARA